MRAIQLGKKILRQDLMDHYVIAEIGVNHENSLDRAYQMIREAKEGGADAVKFQTYKASKLACKNSPAYWDTSKESTRSQHELFSKFDKFGKNEYEALCSFSKELNIDFMSTAFDLESLEFIDPLVSVHKIASADITNTPLLRAVAGTGKPVLISAGASSFVEIQFALDELTKKGASQIGLLHCVLNYPTPPENAFLYRIQKLIAMFPDQVIGYSDHTVPESSCEPVVTAFTLGARIIEKHFTFDRSLVGNDHYHAMDVSSLKNMQSRIADTKRLIGSGSEKDFLAAQGPAIRHARRSIVSKSKILQNEVLTENNVTFKRPGTGISPIYWDEVIGKRATVNINDDTMLAWSHFE